MLEAFRAESCCMFLDLINFSLLYRMFILIFFFQVLGPEDCMYAVGQVSDQTLMTRPKYLLFSNDSVIFFY